MEWKFENGRVYSVNDKDELLAETTFVSKDNGEVTINHTYVNPSLRGQGVAGEMLTAVADFLRKKGLKASASCSYANAWLKKNRESFSDIISGDLDHESVSCNFDKNPKITPTE